MEKDKQIIFETEILKEFKNVICSEKNMSCECISLYDVSQVLKKLNHEYNNIRKNFQKKLDNVVKININQDSSILIYGFDHINKILQVGFKRFKFTNYKDINFTKIHSNLCVTKSESPCIDEVLKLLSKDLSALYDEFFKYSDYINDNTVDTNIETINSRFKVHINNYGVGIFMKTDDKKHVEKYDLFTPNFDESYSINCTSNLIKEAIEGKEKDILKNIFVRIVDCPNYIQSTLYEIRKKQLEEERINYNILSNNLKLDNKPSFDLVFGGFKQREIEPLGKVLIKHKKTNVLKGGTYNVKMH